jgi:hypothetical protein
MAGYKGIGKINGVAIASIAKITGRAKADVWNVSSTPRESNLYDTLTDSGWGSYTQGVNYASFVAVGTTTNAYVTFTISNHTAGDTYNFTFDKTGANTDRTIGLRISTESTLNSIVGGGDSNISLDTGAVSTSLSASSSNTTMYIGFRKVSPSYTGTLTINNFVVTRA